MQAYVLHQLTSRRQTSHAPYPEFLKVPDLSMGRYILRAGEADSQSPHTKDQVCYVVSERARIKVADEGCAAQAGSIVYVAKNVEHLFHSIEEELTMTMFFAPAEYSNRPWAKD